jgi:uncharacterized alpha-E superfamily protein
MDDMTVEEIADMLAKQHAAFYAANPKSEIPHHCLIFTEGGDSFVVDCGWSSAQERSAMLDALAALMASMHAVRYAISSEAWMVMRKTTDPAPYLANYKHGDAAKNPERVEVVTTLVVDISGKIANRFQEIVRDRRGRVVALKPVLGEDGMAGAGAMSELLPRRSVH